jgi:DNA-binding PadR family transcriptional regulator
LTQRIENAKQLSIMSAAPLRLAKVEQLMLLAVLRLEGEAYAVPIRDLIAKEAGVTLSRGSIYVTLDRLEEKALVQSWFSEPLAEPGGKARRLFRITREGIAALRASRRALDRLAAGTVVGRRS